MRAHLWLQDTMTCTPVSHNRFLTGRCQCCRSLARGVPQLTDRACTIQKAPEVPPQQSPRRVVQMSNHCHGRFCCCCQGAIVWFVFGPFWAPTNLYLAVPRIHMKLAQSDPKTHKADAIHWDCRGKGTICCCYHSLTGHTCDGNPTTTTISADPDQNQATQKVGVVVSIFVLLRAVACCFLPVGAPSQRVN